MGGGQIYEDGFAKRYTLDAHGVETLLIEPRE